MLAASWGVTDLYQLDPDADSPSRFYMTDDPLA